MFKIQVNLIYSPSTGPVQLAEYAEASLWVPKPRVSSLHPMKLGRYFFSPFSPIYYNPLQATRVYS